MKRDPATARSKPKMAPGFCMLLSLVGGAAVVAEEPGPPVVWCPPPVVWCPPPVVWCRPPVVWCPPPVPVGEMVVSSVVLDPLTGPESVEAWVVGDAVPLTDVGDTATVVEVVTTDVPEVTGLAELLPNGPVGPVVAEVVGVVTVVVVP